MVGRLHALAALGSIAGTFLTGYWLVQHFGTRHLVIAVSVAQRLLAVPFHPLTRELACRVWERLAADGLDVLNIADRLLGERSR